ncbi:hypothetical protein PVK06_048304 [Gossypium arboreum]|uniref:Uncharacterized protein n=1 Tax=Gossypium arboreum TaxID=29729 RepID=A0ABR0MFY8_GOSAR|nr:hypothetical protein PVK06_048304 [Gossypium arboreum]
MFHCIDYWWIDSIQFDRQPDLALIMFNNITKGIEKEMSTNITLPHGISLSYIFRQLRINTNEDTPLTSNQPISYMALHHSSYHFNANSDEWIKSGLPTAHEDDDAEGAFEDVLTSEHVPSPKHVPLPVAPSQATYSYPNINGAILDALHSLSNNLRGYRDVVNTMLLSLEMQMASLLAHYPLTPPFFLLVMMIRIVIAPS